MSRKKGSAKSPLMSQARNALRLRNEYSEIVETDDTLDRFGKIMFSTLEVFRIRDHLFNGREFGLSESDLVSQNIEQFDDPRFGSMILGYKAIRERVSQAKVFIISEEMLNTTIAAANSLHAEDIVDFCIEDMPSHQGILVFPKDIILSNPNGTTQQIDLSAFSWSFGKVRVRPHEKGMPAGLRIEEWTRTLNKNDDPVVYESFKRSRDDLPEIFPIRSTGIPDMRDWGESSKRCWIGAMGDICEESSRRIESSDFRVENYLSDTPIDDLDGLFALRFMFAFARLCEQKICDVSKTVGDELPNVKEKNKPEQDVIVTRLRKNENADKKSRAVDWSCRWVVSMHKRRQWYPSLGVHKIIFVGPYIKGPEGLNIKERRAESVSALIR